MGVENTATAEEIKTAYREMALKYHPDVNTTGETDQSNARKFREIAEAYAVLSIPENKIIYDRNRLKKQDSVYTNVKSQTMEANRKMRDATGHVPSPKPTRGTYAEHRLKTLEKEREKFNVNHLGYYNGGLPKKNNGAIRGEGFGAPGSLHDVHTHNTVMRPENRDAYEVTGTEADMYKRHESLYSQIKNRPRPYYPLEFDDTWRYVRHRAYANLVILFVFGCYTFSKLYKRELGRQHLNDMLPENIANKPAHHFVNRGGVLIKKEFVGFAKYFKNDKETTDWYYKVYPKIMNLPDK